MTGVPTVEFDGVYEQIGTSAAAYQAYTNARLAVPTPVEIESKGIVTQAGGWIQAKFKAVDTVPYDSMTARFVVIEETSHEYPWTAREVASPATITLSAAGDSAEVTRNFNVAWTVQGDLNVVVFLEEASPFEVINAQIMPPAYNPRLASPDHAEDIDYGGTATYNATLTNTGAVPDTITVSFNQDILPDGIGPTDWESAYREAGGVWMTTPSDFVLDSDEQIDLEVRLIDNVGTTKGMALTTLTAVSAGNAEATDVSSFATFVDQVSILLVDDDEGATSETYLETALADTGITARVWDASVLGRPTLEELSSYWAVIWTTAGSGCEQLTQQDETAMAGYLDQGGNLYLSSMDFLSSRTSSTAFISDYLHISSWSNDVGGFMMAGVYGDPISTGMQLGLSGGPLPNANMDSFVLAEGDIVFKALGTTRASKYEEDGHKLVFSVFPFENVKTTTADPSNQRTLISRILSWFQLPTGVEEWGDQGFAKLKLEQNAPNPFNPETSIAFTIPGGSPKATLQVYDLSGRLVATLLDGAVGSDRQIVTWNGRDGRGEGLASGIYFARLAANGEESFRKMTLLK